MPEVKVFEVLDEGTRMTAVAVGLSPCTPRELELLQRVGFEEPEYYVVVYWPSDDHASYDPYKTRDRSIGRTQFHAQKYIKENFYSLDSGETIDVRRILEEVSS